MSETTTKPITADDLRALEAKGITREIINGQWVDGADDVATGKRHGKIGARLIMQIGPFVEDNDLGEVYQDNTTYVLEGTPGDIRVMVVPDVSFVTKARLTGENPDDFYYQAPDLAVEIISPSERAVDIRNKLNTYLRLGTRQVWQVFPDSQETIVHLPDGSATTYTTMLPGGDLLPGFELDVERIFK